MKIGLSLLASICWRYNRTWNLPTKFLVDDMKWMSVNLNLAKDILELVNGKSRENCYFLYRDIIPQLSSFPKLFHTSIWLNNLSFWFSSFSANDLSQASYQRYRPRGILKKGELSDRRKEQNITKKNPIYETSQKWSIGVHVQYVVQLLFFLNSTILTECPCGYLK